MRPGFTLLELMIVTVIIGILAMVASGPIVEARTRAAIAVTQHEMRTVMKGVEMYMAFNNNKLPTSWAEIATTGVSSHPDILVCNIKAVTDKGKLDDHVRIVLQHRAAGVRVDARYPEKGGAMTVQTKQKKDCKSKE